jgi:S-adenosylmethionine hydrolase
VPAAVSGGPTTPAVFFLSDYGTADEFVGVVHAVLHRLAPLVPVIDLSHQIPPFDVSAGAGLLARCVPHLGAGVVLAVVDPGVGTARRAVAVRTPGSDHRSEGPAWLVGPDNGLLTGAAALLGGAEQVVALRLDGRGWRRPDGGIDRPGPTFAGRDVFAPAASHLVNGSDPAQLGANVDPGSLVAAPADLEVTPAGPLRVGSTVTTPVISIDRFGNAQLALRPHVLDDIGLAPGGSAEVSVRPEPATARPREPGPAPGAPHQAIPARRVGAFAELAAGELGLVTDGNGRVALVLDRASAADRLHLTGPGAEVRIAPALHPRG